MNKITTAQKTLEYYVVLSGESTPPGPTPTQVTIDGNFEIEQSGSTYKMSFGIQDFDWSSLQSGWTGTVVYGQNTLTFDSSNLNNNTITISVSESQIDLTATTATMEITSGTDEYEGTSNVEVGFVDYMYIENTYNGQNTVTLNTVKSTNIPPSGTYATSVQYSKDRINWTTLTLTVGGTNNITLNQGEKVYFRNDSGKWNYYDRATSKWLSNCFSAEYSHSTGGNINSLGDYNNMSNFTLPQGFIFKLFGIDASTGDTTLNDIYDLRMTATTMTPYCYKNVFSNCSSITTIPQDFLPATNTADGCYMFMFQNTGVTEIPNNLLKATTTSNSCYQGMFESCVSLVNVPSNLLPATTLSTGCYRSMFYGCSSLVVAPELPATTLAGSCYYAMFRECSSLNQVTTYANDISASNCLSNWLNGVATTGTFFNLGSATYSSGASGIPSGWTEVKPDLTDYFYVENTYNGTNTLTLTTTKVGSPTTDYSTTVQYSKDRTNWTTVTFDTSNPYNISMNQGDKVYFRNNNGKFNCCNTMETVYYATTITGSQTHKTGGDIRSLLDYTNIQSSGPGCFYRLFYNDTNLVSSSELTLPPTVGFASLAQIFMGCTSLATVSAIPATTTLSERCYAQMFSGCSSLVTAPTLPATTLARNCYDNMFRGCSSLVSTPNLPATVMYKQCYNSMFRECSSLTSVSSLPATVLEDGCYGNMFMDCTSLTSVPSDLLPATNLQYARVYYQMFRGCTNLVKAPVLPAATLTSNCYYYMFYGCSALNEVTTFADNISASNSHTSWLYGVAATGTFYNYGTASWPTNSATGIPSGWTVVTQ